MSSHRRRNRVHLIMESLEDRIVPSVSESYNGPYDNRYSFSREGVNVPEVDITTADDTQYQITLDPITETSPTPLTFLALRRAR